MIVTRGYLLSYIHRLLTIYNKRTFEPRLIFESFSSWTTGNPGSLFVSLFITWVNIEKSRSGNLLESGDKNRWNLPCGELLLSLICTRSFGKNSLLHLSFKETIFLETCLQKKRQQQLAQLVSFTQWAWFTCALTRWLQFCEISPGNKQSCESFPRDLT